MLFAPLLLISNAAVNFGPVHPWANGQEWVLGLHASAILLTAGPAGIQLDYYPHCPSALQTHPSPTPLAVCEVPFLRGPTALGIVRLLYFLT